MKQKFLLIIGFLLIFTAIPVLSDEVEETLQDAESVPVEFVKPTQTDNAVKPVILPPKWTDFCELGYENAVYKDSNDIFNIFTFVKSERVKKNYWAERRVSFENYLKSCDALDDDAKAACYVELKKSEEQKNDLYRQKRKQLLYENNIQLDRR